MELNIPFSQIDYEITEIGKKIMEGCDYKGILLGSENVKEIIVGRQVLKILDDLFDVRLQLDHLRMVLDQ